MAELHRAPSGLLTEEGEHGGEKVKEGDYPPMKSFQDFRHVWCVESSKLWVIAAPIAFNIICNYGINSFTNIFVGHIGPLELSAVAVSLSVFGGFIFGFMVSSPARDTMKE